MNKPIDDFNVSITGGAYADSDHARYDMDNAKQTITKAKKDTQYPTKCDKLTLVQLVNLALSNKSISTASAASILTMRIKSCILSGVRSECNGISIDDVIYIDKILFNGMEAMLKSVIDASIFCSVNTLTIVALNSVYSKELLNGYINDTLKSLDYAIDLTEVNSIIDEFYNTLG